MRAELDDFRRDWRAKNTLMLRRLTRLVMAALEAAIQPFHATAV
jgi:hypothetical protein